MDPEDVINLFDSCWFNLEIFKKQSFSLKSETSPSSQPKFLSLRSILMRSKSDQLSSMSSIYYGSLSPNSVLFTPQLQTIVSGKEVKLEESTPDPRHVEEKQEQEQERPNKSPTSGKEEQENPKKGQRRAKKGVSKSLSDLEFEELKGFMDLGFVFSKEDKDSSLVEIIPGLQRLGKEKDEDDQELESSGSAIDHESLVERPYLSEAWEAFDRRKREKPLMNWRVPALSNEIDMKDSLKWWAHTVASAVR